MADAVWLTEQDVVALMDLPEAIPALERALRHEAAGEALNMPKTLLQFGHHNLHALGAKLGDVVGTKSWVHTGGGTSPLLLLWDAHDGSLLAVIEAFALGNLRTGGISGVAADWMAAPDARVLALVGSGRQALSQLGAIIAVRRIERVRVYSPRPKSRAEFIERARRVFDVDIVEAASVEAACEDAHIVTLVTRAAQPLLGSAALRRGTHVNAVGAIAPDREEFHQDLFHRASLVAVDNLQAVQQLSRELMTRYRDRGWQDVRLLSEVVASGRRRTPADDLTLFKAMGMGISDVALGAELLQRARSSGHGRPVPQPRKQEARVSTRRSTP